MNETGTLECDVWHRVGPSTCFTYEDRPRNQCKAMETLGVILEYACGSLLVKCSLLWLF